MLDPFFAKLRERRPDIDIVILPPPAPRDSGNLADAATLTESAQSVAATATALAAGLPGADISGPEWSDLGEDGVRREARINVEAVDGAAILTRLENDYLQAGWQSHLAVKAYYRWLASQPLVQVVATWSEAHNGLNVTVSGRLLRPAPGSMEGLA